MILDFELFPWKQFYDIWTGLNCDGWQECTLIKMPAKEESCVSNKSAFHPFGSNHQRFHGSSVKGKAYIGKAQDVHKNEAYIHFLSRNGNLHHLSKFKLPSVKEQVWVPINSMFWVTPSSFQQKEPLNFVLRQPAMFWRSCKSCLNVSNFL